MEEILSQLASGMGEAWPLALLLLYYLRRMDTRFSEMKSELAAIRKALGVADPGPTPELPKPGNPPEGPEMNAAEAIRALAAERYGPDFLPAAEVTAANIGIPLDTLLAVIAAETTYFKANGGDPAEGGDGTTWPVNTFDKGGGLIGWTSSKKIDFNIAFPVIARKGPVGQLADVETYYLRKFEQLGIDGVDTLLDAYLIVRGPLAIIEPEKYSDIIASSAPYIETIAAGKGKGGPFHQGSKGASKAKKVQGDGGAAGALVALAVAAMVGVGLYFGRKG